MNGIDGNPAGNAIPAQIPIYRDIYDYFMFIRSQLDYRKGTYVFNLRKKLYCEQINNIRFRTATAVHALTRPMRDALAERCLNGERLNRSEIKKILGTFCDEKIVAVNLAEETTNIAPFALVAAFADVPHWREMSEAEQDALLDFIAEPRPGL